MVRAGRRLRSGLFFLMLLTDSDVITQADLEKLDAEVQLVATSVKPSLILDGDGSVCAAAWEEASQQILSSMQMYANYLVPWGTSAGHVSAVLNTGLSRTQPRCRLNQVVAHEWNYANSQSPLQRWLSYAALARYYRDAAGRITGNDRYETKFERYEQQAADKWRVLRQQGLPIVYQPLEAPGAKHGFNAGTWDSSNVTLVSAPGAAGGTFSIAVTYVDSSKYTSQSDKGNGESAPSAVQSLVVSADQAVSVSIASLNPPTGSMDAVGTTQGIWTPLKATHWNLWVGDTDGPLYLQQELIPIATKTASLSVDPVLSGSTMGNGQYPDIALVFMNIAMRA